MSPKSALLRATPLLLMCLTLSFTAACAHRSSTREVQTVSATAADLKAKVPETSREKCAAADLPPGPKPGEVEYQIFGTRQTDLLGICDTKRALAVDALDLHNTYVDKLVSDLKPKPWWKFWDR